MTEEDDNEEDLASYSRKSESPWNNDGDWKGRYSRLYSSRRLFLPKEEPSQRSDRISFLSEESMPYTNLLIKIRETAKNDSVDSTILPPNSNRTSILSPQSDIFNIKSQSQDLGGHETRLLDIVRERSREMKAEAQNRLLDLPKQDTDDDDDASSEACIHGLNLRMTERSISRSRVSRISTRRDMDIPSILAFTTSTTPASTSIGIPAFQNLGEQEQKDVPRWSIRRSVCPVCSQKWKDRSSIANVKNSGLKRNAAQDFPTVKASAKLRTSIALRHNPRPALAAVDEEEGIASGRLRSNSAAWQLIRARRIRTPKLTKPSLESTVPPSVAPLAQKDLDLRVNRFLTNQQV